MNKGVGRLKNLQCPFVLYVLASDFFFFLLILLFVHLLSVLKMF